MLNDLLLLDFLQHLINLLLKSHSLLLAHLFLDFCYVFFSPCVALLTVFPQFVVVGLLDMLNESCTISDARALKSVDDGAASVVEPVRSAYLHFITVTKRQ